MLASIDVKFMFDSARLTLFSSENILQIADFALRGLFLLFLPCLILAIISPSSSLETSEMSAVFVFTTKKLNLVPKSSRLTVY